MKALAVLRVSTSGQQIDDQREELYAYIKSMGYDEIVPVEAIGASAVKLDAKYMEMAKKIKETILEGGIDAVCVWEISRLGRNEAILMDFKEFFIKNKVQFICKTPSLKLLNDDGSVNGGTEIAFSLFSTMAKQEAQENKARFHRAKSAMAKVGKYVGGNTIRYGYYVDEQGYFKELPEEGSVVRQVYELYATGKYSSYTLSAELDTRGITISPYKIAAIISCPAYIGDEISKSGMHYPPIISKELFEEVKKVREKNKIDMKKKGISLGAKLIKCYKCGAVYSSNTRHYACCRSGKHNCDNNLKLNMEIADALLWKIASIEHFEHITNLTADKEKEYKKEIELLQQKARALDEKVEKCGVKQARIAESYIDGLIDRENRDLRLLKVKDEESAHLAAKAALQERIDAIAGLLEGIDKDEDYINALADAAVIDYTDEEKFDIIHKHIISLIPEPMSYGKRDPRTHKPNAVHITITTALGNVSEYLYFPKFYEKHKLYVLSRGRWMPDD